MQQELAESEGCLIIVPEQFLGLINERFLSKSNVKESAEIPAVTFEELGHVLRQIPPPEKRRVDVFASVRD